MADAPQHVVGVISDTHGLVRPEAERALQGCDSIIHAGDVGGNEVIAKLRRIAPVVAVRGNMDRGAWATHLPRTKAVEVGDCLLYVLHELMALDLDPVAAGVHAVIFGHTHRPRIERQDGVLFFNPGSAGPRRYAIPASVGRIRISGTDLEPEVIDLP
jgi:putative phosphoesterase